MRARAPAFRGKFQHSKIRQVEYSVSNNAKYTSVQRINESQKIFIVPPTSSHLKKIAYYRLLNLSYAL